MKELRTSYPYDEFKRIALSKTQWDGDVEFIKLLIPAVRELDNEGLAYTIEYISMRFLMLSNKAKATHVTFIREYVRRVELEREEQYEREKKAKESLRLLREELQKDPSFTGIQRSTKLEPKCPTCYIRLKLIFDTQSYKCPLCNFSLSKELLDDNLSDLSESSLRTKDCGHDSWVNGICKQCGAIKPPWKPGVYNQNDPGNITASGIRAMYNQLNTKFYMNNPRQTGKSFFAQYQQHQKQIWTDTCDICKGSYPAASVVIDAVSGTRFCTLCYNAYKGKKP
jgi:hypothetical protein